MPTTIVTHAGKGSALTYTEADANFTNLQTTADAAAATIADDIPQKTAVTTEAIESDTSITVTIGGVSYKLLARAVP